MNDNVNLKIYSYIKTVGDVIAFIAVRIQILRQEDGTHPPPTNRIKSSNNITLPCRKLNYWKIQ